MRGRGRFTPALAETAVAARSGGGRDAAKLGLALEHHLNSLHEFYRRTGRAYVDQRHTHNICVNQKIAGRNYRVFVKAEPGPPDFTGAIAGGGLRVAFDAKAREDGRRLDDMTATARRRERQCRELMETARAGGIAGYYVYIARGPAAGYYWVPVLDNARWASVFAGKVPSILLVGDEAAEWGVMKLGPGGDWLAAVNEMRAGGSR